MISRKSSLSSLIEPSSFPNSTQAKNPDVESAPHFLCGCLQHSENNVLSLVGIEFEKVYQELVQNTGGVQIRALTKLSHQLLDCAPEDIRWSIDEFGVRRRSLVVQFGLPTPILKSTALVKANFIDTILTDQISRLLVMETRIIFEGIPGGSCSASIRQCLVNINGRSQLSVSCEVLAPENSWLKESVRMALLNQIQRLYQEIGHQITGELSKREPFENTIQQVYFDPGAFCRSMRTLLPVLVLALATIGFILKFSQFRNTAVICSGSHSCDGNSRTEAIHLQYKKYLDDLDLSSNQALKRMEDLEQRFSNI